MQNNKTTVILILIILCVYFLFSQFYLKTLGSTYTYIVNPAFFVILAIILKITIQSPYQNKKNKKK